jgi:hypothetical protein
MPETRGTYGALILKIKIFPSKILKNLEIMNLDKAIKNIDRSLTKKQPAYFSPSWIKYRCKISYQFIIENIKTEFNEPDWDLVVSKLERCNQGLWLKGKKKKAFELYEDKIELNAILNKYNNKLYVFLSGKGKEDRIVCNWISIRLARLSQKGNILAKKKLVGLLIYPINQWIEYDRSLYAWKGYNELIIEHVEACIRRFRYAGSFLGYLYRTLEYSGRGLVPLEKFSLDDFSPITKKRKIDSLFISCLKR